MPTSLGFLLALHPEDPRAQAALAFLEDLQNRRPSSRHFVYCLGAGVSGVEDPRLQQLRQNGVHLLACAQSALQQGIQPGHQATFGGLGLLNDLLAGLDSFAAVGPGSPHPWTAPELPSFQSTRPACRQVVILLTGNPGDTGRITEAVRVAAGLRAAGDLPVALVVTELALEVWAALLQPGQHPDLYEHLQLFQHHGGQILVTAPASSSTPPRPSIEGGPLHTELLPPSAREALLARTFALIPF